MGRGIVGGRSGGNEKKREARRSTQRDSLLFETTATLEGGEWKLKDPIVAPLSARLRCLYPSKGLQRLDQEFLYDFSEQQEALYYTDSVTPQSSVYAVSFVPLLPKQRVTLDMSALPSDALLEELSTNPPYTINSRHR